MDKSDDTGLSEDSSAPDANANDTAAGLGAAGNLPAISVPKGGGAIRGSGETFAANPVTGSGTMTLPLPLSPGRTGFTPKLSLSYDSGNGNGPFGFGWSLSLPQISRKTDKRLPEYRDAEDSDVFLLSGSEDLVPLLLLNGARYADASTNPGFVIHRYRPRVEGLFARIERWTDIDTGDIHWRTISRDNITTIFGKDNRARIFDPAEADTPHPRRIFAWLICETFDDKGNAIVYDYAGENDVGVNRFLANERNRDRTANRYIKRIKYGNRVSRHVQPDLTRAQWLFELVFDYDDGHHLELAPDPQRSAAAQHRYVQACNDTHGNWQARPDPFSVFRPGFEVRTYRRCHRILMFHRFRELGTEPCLVRDMSFLYDDLVRHDPDKPLDVDDELGHQGSTRFASFIHHVVQSGYVRDQERPVVTRDGKRYVTYLQKSLPPLTFAYSKAQIHEGVRTIDAESRSNLPEGVDGGRYRWVDLDGEGLAGILTQSSGAWQYKPNRGKGRFGATQTLRTQPAASAEPGSAGQLLDLSGDGQLDLVAFAGATPGFYARSDADSWSEFTPFRSLPNIPWSDPNIRFVDLNGDGHADILVTEEQVFTWYPSLAERGFAAARQVRQPRDEEKGPRPIFADPTQAIYLADMSGDGLADLVRIRNGAVCYWPNLGYGRFGAKVAMDNAPWFDHPDRFSQKRMLLADIDGSGTSDIIYLGGNEVTLYFNQAGNAWSAGRTLRDVAPPEGTSAVTTADLWGSGTTCLVWSSPLPTDANHPLRYIDLLGGNKPHLLTSAVNNLGNETHIPFRWSRGSIPTIASAKIGLSPVTPTITAISTVTNGNFAALVSSNRSTPRISRP